VRVHALLRVRGRDRTGALSSGTGTPAAAGNQNKQETDFSIR